MDTTSPAGNPQTLSAETLFPQLFSGPDASDPKYSAYFELLKLPMRRIGPAGDGGKVFTRPIAGRDAPAQSERPTIVIGPRIMQMTDAAISGLSSWSQCPRPTSDLYQYGETLAEVYQTSEGHSSLRTVEQPRMVEILSECVDWMSGGDDDASHVRPPVDVVRAALTRRTWPGVRRLMGIVEYPYMGEDGRPRCDPGYDPGTQIYLVNGPYSVPHRPTMQMVMQSLESLMEIVHDFQFETEPDKAAWLAAMLTPAARKMFRGNIPVIYFGCSTAGAGKSLLAKCLSLVYLGREYPVSSLETINSEIRKQITSHLLRGESMVFWDNVTTYGGPELDRLATSENWSDRILGGNELTGSLPNLTTWIITGNNVLFAGDSARRVMRIRIDPQVENPESRTGFRHADLKGWVLSNRNRLMTDILTILRGWVIAGRPTMDGVSTFGGGFEGWSAVIPHVVRWLGLDDPCQSRINLVEKANQDNRLERLLIAWQNVYSDIPATVADVLAYCREYPGSDLDLVLGDIAPPDKPNRNAAIGKWLNAHRGIVRCGIRLVSDAKDRTGKVLWHIQSVGA